MSSGTTVRRCTYCTQRHAPRHLCDPARKVLDALQARGMSFDMPTVEFPDPIRDVMPALGLAPGDALVAQLVVQAAIIDVAGVARPAVILTGRTPFDEPLPRWVYGGDDTEMAKLSALVQEMTSMAVRRAAAARGEHTGQDSPEAAGG